jgi:hypothetical protein
MNEAPRPKPKYGGRMKVVKTTRRRTQRKVDQDRKPSSGPQAREAECSIRRGSGC